MISTIKIGNVTYIVKPETEDQSARRIIEIIAWLHGPRGALGTVTRNLRTGWLNCIGITAIERMPIGYANQALRPLVDQEG